MPTLLNSIGGAPPDHFKLAVALGKVPGWRVFRKFGMNDDVDTGTEYMWPLGTDRTLPSVAAVASIVSSSAEDDENEATPPGTGAYNVVVEGLDTDYVEVSETVTLTGTVAATSTQTFLRINRAYIQDTGSTGGNVGNITISVGGNAQAYIEAGEGQTHQLFYTVPANHYFVVDYYSITTGRLGNTDVQALALIKLYGTTGWRAISDINPYETQFENASSMTLIPPKTEAKVRITSTATNAETSGLFGGYLVNINYL